jgi:hypothetical protein
MLMGVNFFFGFWGKETILFSLEEKKKLALKILKNHFSGLGVKMRLKDLKGEFTRDGGMESINHLLYIMLTRILIYPPRWYSKWNNRFICIIYLKN